MGCSIGCANLQLTSTRQTPTQPAKDQVAGLAGGCHVICHILHKTGTWSSARSGQRLIAKRHLRLVQNVARAPPLLVACGLHCKTTISALTPPHSADAMQRCVQLPKVQL